MVNCPHFIAFPRTCRYGGYHRRRSSQWINLALGIRSCCHICWYRANPDYPLPRRNILSSTHSGRKAAPTQITNDAHDWRGATEATLHREQFLRSCQSTSIDHSEAASLAELCLLLLHICIRHWKQCDNKCFPYPGI